MRVKLFFTIVVLLLLVIIAVSITLRHLIQKKKRTMSMPAIVISTRSARQSRNGKKERYYATFELHNSEKKELKLPKHMMEHVKVGQKGMITFTSQQLLSFKKGNHPSFLFTQFSREKM